MSEKDKAAPVGEREAAIEAAYAAVADRGWTSVKDMGIQMFQAGAAYQRAAQPSAGAVMPERKQLPDLMFAEFHESRGWNACLDEFASLNGKEVGRG